MKLKKMPGPALALLIMLSSVLSAQAVDVKFSGNLMVPPPCEINNNNAISVMFDDDMIAGRLDGVNYEQPITYVIDCKEAISTALRLQFQGVGAGPDPSLLATSEPSVGLLLRSDGVKLPMNTWLNFTTPSRPVLTATPMSLEMLTEGGLFTATATLVVDYQ